MSTADINNIQHEQPQKRQLERARVDFSSTKTQMLLGALLISVSCLVAYAQTVLVTFLGQDLTYIQAIADTLHGSFDQVLANPTSILLIDYLLYHTNTLGFHVSNILLTASCAIIVGLITLELTGRLGNRNGALSAVWAGLLFSVYPLHAQSVAIVSGRIELIASLFYLLSVFSFLRYRLIEEKQYFLLSLTSAALALVISAQSLSLPLVITLLAFHPGRNRFARTQNLITDVTTCSGLYWIVAALTFFLHPLYLGPVDKKTLLLLFFPVNETVVSVGKIAPLALIPLICALLVLLLKSQIAKLRLNQTTQIASSTSSGSPSSTITALILTAWLGLAILPLTAHDSHLFLAAAPFSMIIAILSLESGNTTDKDAKLLTTCGLVAMSLLYLSWSYLLAINLKPTVEGSLIVENFRRQLINTATVNQSLTLTNWPKTHQGVPLIHAAENLKLFLAPPFIDRDLSAGLKVMREVTPVQNNLQIYQWQQAHGLLAALPQTQTVKPFSTGNIIWSASNKAFFVNLLKGSEWQLVDSTGQTETSSEPQQLVNKNTPVLSLMKDSARLWASDKQAILWFNDKIDQPILQADRWLLKIDIGAGSVSTVELAVRNYGAETKLTKLEGKRIGSAVFFDLRALDDYLFNGESQQIGIVVAPSEVVSISSVQFVSVESIGK